MSTEPWNRSYRRGKRESLLFRGAFGRKWASPRNPSALIQTYRMPAETAPGRAGAGRVRALPFPAPRGGAETGPTPAGE